MQSLTDRISRHGSVRFDEFMELALYDPDEGFFATGGGAGRSGADFLTSPEVGPLFGAVVARYLDARWQELGRPDPFVVVEAAAGRGALAIAVLAAAPACAHALRYVLVERSSGLRARQAEHLSMVHPFEVFGPSEDEDLGIDAPDRASGPLVCALEDLPAASFDGVVIANELLDNIPVRLLERTTEGADGVDWNEVRVTQDGDICVELLVPADAAAAETASVIAPGAPSGARIPLQAGAAEWLHRALSICRTGSVLVIDYSASTPELAERPTAEWLRTYRRQARGVGVLDSPGTQDITCEVAVDQLAALEAPAERTTQADWLRRHGIDELVEDGRRIWTERAGAPDLAAMRARSRVAESEALLDPTGLGAFEVLEWRR